MASGERLGASFAIDVTNLKAGLAQANRMIRESESEFKAAAAGMDDWTKSEEGLSKKIKSLNDVAALQKKKVDALTSEYESLIAKGLDPTSQQAIKLRTQINNETAVLKKNEAEIKNQKKALSDLGDGLDDAGDAAEKSEKKFSSFGAVLKATAATLGAVIVAAGAAAAKLGKDAISAYADYEQLVGGVETLFKDSAKELQGYAANAYKTAGLSANDYMETVTSFSASLIQSLGGDTAKAAKYADKALTDMSDNANKMGSDMDSIMNAYRGFSKQTFTMLDNLKLGYGGTKEEMQRLLKDAQKISGIKYNISSYADIVDAIHVIQTEMGVTGTTAKEAEETISGSLGMLKTSFQNLVTGLGDSEADIVQLSKNVVNSLVSVVNNIQPVIQNIIKALPTAIDGILYAMRQFIPQFLKVGSELFGAVVMGISDTLPDVLNVVTEMLPTIIRVITENIPKIVEAIVDAVPKITSALLDSLPQIISSVVTMATGIIAQLKNLLPQIVEQIIEIAPEIIDALVEAIPELLDAAIEFLNAIVDAIPVIIPKLLEALPKIIDSIVNGLVTALPQIIDGAIQLLMGIIDALPTIIDAIIENLPTIISTIIEGLVKSQDAIIEGAVQLFNGIIDAIPILLEKLVPKLPEIVMMIVDTLIDNIPILLEGAWKMFKAILTLVPKLATDLALKVPDIVDSLIDGLKDGIERIKEVGGDWVRGLWEGIKNVKDWIVEKIKGFGSSILGGIKDFFGIHSPSTVMADVVGKNLALGIGKGFEDNIGSVNDDISDAFDFDDPNYPRKVVGGRGVVVYQTNNYSQAHSRLELYKSKQATAAAVRLALGGI